MPVDPESLAALSDLTARTGRSPILPGAAPRTGSAPSAGGPTQTAPAAALDGRTDGRTDGLALLRAVDPATRNRVLALGAGSVLAGLVCGLLVPATAEAGVPAAAAAPTRAAAVLALPTATAGSPFAGLAARRPAARSAARPAGPAKTAVRTGSTGTTAASTSPRTTTHRPTPALVVPLGSAHAALLLRAERLAAPAPASTSTTAGQAAAAPPSGGWHPTRALPRGSGTGRRIVYAERAAHLWIVDEHGVVLRDYKVTGRIDRPRPGVYHVWSKSPHTSNPKERLRFDLMVRFAHGYTGAPIGFHTIPRTYAGVPIQSEKALGTPVGRGGCVRQSLVDATWLYAWVRVGDTVVVLR